MNEISGKVIEEIKDALVGIKDQLETINKTLQQLKVAAENNSKPRILPVIERKNIT
jgi:hypothetical protein